MATDFLGGTGKYRGRLDQEQLEFIHNNLGMIPEKQMVVLLMHNHRNLYHLIEMRPLCILVFGRTHFHEHPFLTCKGDWIEGASPPYC